MNFREFEEIMFAGFHPDQLLMTSMIYEQMAHSYTLEDEESNIVGCGGVIDIWRGVGHAWLLVSKEAEKNPFASLIVSREVMEAMFDDGYHRIQATVLNGFQKAMRFIEFLKFKPESILKNYGPNKEDFIMYARTNNVGS